MIELKKAAEARPDDAGVQETYAAALLAQGKAAEALHRLDPLPETLDRHRLRGDALTILGRYREAADAFRAAGSVRDTPERLIETLRLIGGGAMEGRDWRQAATAYEELKTLGAADPLVLNNLAFAYGELGKYDAAIPLAREAVAIRPGDPAALDTLGWLLVKSGRDKAEGVKLLERAAMAAPGDSAIRDHLEKARGS
ncbi:tetratricopeptide repeat protein [Allosphingosinicella flava]|uniref:Tetratricopeptide repeat protein n=1 Tax=Allosphingosinicella flava TaxID=2771430 RepID=A0A7T2GJ28_9SPHN|nr:tetratricopeptide repeat protein [Sphingosinicella flava]QPQ54792.1 tetratricopeptide repeat protein [Sphingosinicella flava]